MRNQLGLLLIIMLVLSSCGKKDKASQNPPEAPPASRLGVDPVPEAQASPEIGHSFTQAAVATSTSGTTTADVSHVVIKKSAMNKEFLLLTDITNLLPAPQFSSLDSLIVSFIKRDQKIYMLNATRTQQIGQNRDDLPLAEFLILSENSEQFEIDFNNGMNQLFTASKLVNVDDTGGGAGLVTAQFQLSYLDQVKFENETLFIIQKAQLRDGPVVSPVEVRYRLKPYQPDPHYVPFVSNDDTKVGFIKNSVPAIQQNGEEINYANRWNPAKKIQFAISANTPVEMRETIRNGLLYWNRVLGAGKVEVIQLEDLSIKAPYPDLNIVQWVDWDNLGTAYETFQTDPRTGEILSSNIFIPSGKPPVEGSRIALYNLGLKGFASARTAETPEPQVAIFNQLTKKMAMNNLFVTVAHESGHALGLEHNFAGSLTANYDFKDRKAILEASIRNRAVPNDLVVASTVMDYLAPEDKSLLAETIFKNQNALPYDLMAISHLYLNRPLPNAGRPAYCTNSDVGNFADCKMFDSAKSIVSYASGSYQNDIENLPLLLFRLYFPLNRLTTDPSSVREVNINTTRITDNISASFYQLAALLKSPDLIAVRAPHMPVIRTQNNAIWDEEQEYLKNEFTRLGGLQKLLEPIPTTLNTTIEQKFQTLLSEPSSQSAALSAADREFVLAQVKIAARQIRNKLILNQIKALSGSDPSDPNKLNIWTESDLTASLPALIESYFNFYTFDKVEAPLAVELTGLDGTKQTVQLPDYYYNEQVRLAAAELFNGKADSAGWAYAEKLRAIQAVERDIALLGDQSKIDMTKLSASATSWLLTNRTILSKLRGSLPLSQDRNN